MTEKLLNALLLAIALGLWVNALKPATVHADSSYDARIYRELEDINSKLMLIESNTANSGSSSSPHPPNCPGTLKANAWGGVEASLGGYSVSLDCK